MLELPGSDNCRPSVKLDGRYIAEIYSSSGGNSDRLGDYLLDVSGKHKYRLRNARYADRKTAELANTGSMKGPPEEVLKGNHLYKICHLDFFLKPVPTSVPGSPFGGFESRTVLSDYDPEKDSKR